jgi:hypothetical protein
MKYLFLDDIRHPYDAFNYTKQSMFLHKKWDIVRSYDEFVNYIVVNGLPDFISFDHDLVDEHYIHNNIDEYKEKTGMECARYLIDYCIENEKLCPEYYVHSMNTIGKENIISLLQQFKKL